MTIIKRVNIPEFGSYKDFVWNDSIKNSKGEVVDFRQLNILYGRNYSGKTTLSRIFRMLETGECPDGFFPCDFSITTDKGIITSENISNCDVDIRVYNSDFVGQNLSFLRDHNGNINPFAVVGEKNTEIEKQIQDLTADLGSVESKSGLYYLEDSKLLAVQKAKKEHDSKAGALEAKIKTKANDKKVGIKYKFNQPTYNVTRLNADITRVLSDKYQELSEEDFKRYGELLRDKELPEITTVVSLPSDFSQLYSSSKALIEKNIAPSKPIQKLLENSLLQEWVKNGQKFHKSTEHCEFCGNPLPDDLLARLDAHFDQESEALETKIKGKIQDLEQDIESLQDDLSLSSNEFYSEYKDAFEEKRADYKNKISQYKNNLQSIISLLQGKLSNIFSVKKMIPLADITQGLQLLEVEINSLIKSNNAKTLTLKNDQQIASQSLLLHDVFNFLTEIQYIDAVKEIDKCKKSHTTLNSEYVMISGQISAKKQAIAELQTQMKDERKGAEKVNEYLNNFFGHNSLMLEATEVEGGKAYKFEIKRGERLAKNLSEGECSLVAFCYFLAKLEDTESKDKKLIIYIDDPISSLDSNHIFFVYSLIEGLIAKPIGEDAGNKLYGYEQLFVSTHNLDFLKYLKRISKPKKQFEQFLISQKLDRSSIELMPQYLKNYVTEFNYLFGEIYICSQEGNQATHHNSFYNFGNNMRKFLEAFLFFKYPFSQNESNDHNVRVEKFFNDSPVDEPLVQRVINEFSHLAGQFDRSAEPLDYAEITKLAQFVLKKIELNDKDQFDHLVESVTSV